MGRGAGRGGPPGVDPGYAPRPRRRPIELPLLRLHQPHLRRQNSQRRHRSAPNPRPTRRQKQRQDPRHSRLHSSTRTLLPRPGRTLLQTRAYQVIHAPSRNFNLEIKRVRRFGCADRTFGE